jgi:hypothetical protein
MPAQSLRYPDTPEARAAYDHALRQARAAGGGKLPPMPGSPVFTPGQGMTLDLAANVGPKVIGVAKGLRLLPLKPAIDALRAESSKALQTIGEGERAIIETLDRMASSPRGTGNAWVSVAEGGREFICG